MTDDRALQHDVMAELEWEPRLEHARIGVTAEAGVVTLSGHVHSLPEHDAALAAARRVRGVRAIADEVEIRLPGDRKVHDDEIARRAADILRWSHPGLADRIRIGVAHGRVTLDGVVPRYFDRGEAEREIRKLSGVTAIDNRLLIRSAVSPAGIRERIEAAFRRSADLEALNVRVIVEGSAVELHGKVFSLAERAAAERAAEAAPGVTEVRNLIEIDDCCDADDLP